MDPLDLQKVPGQKTIPRKEDDAFFAVHGVESTFFVLVLFAQFAERYRDDFFIVYLIRGTLHCTFVDTQC
jgi:hypothetical protein